MKKLNLIIVCLICTLLTNQGIGNVIFFDDFNSENGGNYQLNYSSFSNWSVTEGTVDLIGVGSPWNWFPSNGLYVDMDGSTGNAGKMISTATLDLQPGFYLLSFDLAGNQRNTSPEEVAVEVNMGNLLAKTYNMNRDDPFQTFSESFYVNSLTSVSLSFEGLGGDNVGMLLDNVKLSCIPAPGAILLGSIGIGLVGYLRRRKTL